VTPVQHVEKFAHQHVKLYRPYAVFFISTIPLVYVFSYTHTLVHCTVTPIRRDDINIPFLKSMCVIVRHKQKMQNLKYSHILLHIRSIPLSGKRCCITFYSTVVLNIIEHLSRR